MLDLLKILFTLAFLVALLRKKMQVGYVLLLGALLLAVMYLMPPMAVLSAIGGALKNTETVKLAIALTAIRGFELVTRENDVMSRMMLAAKGMLRGRKAFIISMPVLIGMLPSIGGAYFSAPMVEESTKGLAMKPDEKGFINYWFRHPWEYILPLYPGLVLAAALTGYDIRSIILFNLPYSITIMLAGFIFSMRGHMKEHVPVDRKSAIKNLPSFIPVLSVLVLVIVFGLGLHLALLAGLAGLVLYFRYTPRGVIRIFKHCLQPDVIFLIAGAMIFQEVMKDSGAVANLSRFFESTGIPLMPLLFVLPFVSGLLTGLSVGFVSATFPLILSLPAGRALPNVSFAYASGFLGVLLSPVHVCFILSREYFKADMWAMYKKILPAAGMVFAVAVTERLLVMHGVL